MAPANHYIFFQRTDGHCATWLLRATTLHDALILYARKEAGIIVRPEDGCFLVNDGFGGKLVYPHILAVIEGEDKVHADLEFKHLQWQHIDAEYAEVFCSAHPYEVEQYIAFCRPMFRQRYPRSRASAFSWYLKDGPLVTFYRRPRRDRAGQIEVLGRYLLRWNDWPEPVEWTGSYDDILDQMNVEYPLP